MNQSSARVPHCVRNIQGFLCFFKGFSYKVTLNLKKNQLAARDLTYQK